MTRPWPIHLESLRSAYRQLFEVCVRLEETPARVRLNLFKRPALCLRPQQITPIARAIATTIEIPFFIGELII